MALDPDYITDDTTRGSISGPPDSATTAATHRISLIEKWAPLSPNLQLA